MLTCFAPRAGADTVPIVPVTRDGFSKWLKTLSASNRTWLQQSGFAGESWTHALIPDEKGRIARVAVGVESAGHVFALGGLAQTLPSRTYSLTADLDDAAATRVALGWALGAYVFTRYKKAKRETAKLVWPKGADRDQVEAQARAIYLARDLINTPADDLGPSQLADAAKAMARRHRAKVEVIVGDALLKRNYPSIHTVGRAADNQPRLIDIRWGSARNPKVTLVGKGVCFDSGGLDIKGAASMKMMKKDMGGSAAVLALGDMIMSAGLKVRLRVMVPAVENAISGNAFRPLDVIRTRKGLTVEVGNTDAEGRLILCDALAEADSEKPDLIVDFATLTGAARVALGPQLPALFTNDDRLAAEWEKAAACTSDPIYRMPLWQPYRKMIESKVADLSSTGDSPFAGSVTAALFLESFVSKGTSWAHVDTFAWNERTQPGRPEGGEALGVRGLFQLLADRYGR
ncbi:MAG: leucyl aminopeptidase family protein [Alphaproteobacteria bacterium]|nr:leucyl aminopeptidase family protein [Alphaproteobacteria bacterium]